MDDYTQHIHSIGTTLYPIDPFYSAVDSTGILLITCIKLKQTDNNW